MNDFWVDYIKSREVSRSEELKNCYEKKLCSKIAKRIEIDKKNQQKAGYDIELHLEDGRILTIEEKIRFKFYPDLLVEIKHYNGNEKPGWLFKSQAEILSYVQPYKKGYHITLWKLKDIAEWVRSEQFYRLYNAGVIIEKWGSTNFNGNKYRTKNYAISFRILRNLPFEYKKNDENLPIEMW